MIPNCRFYINHANIENILKEYSSLPHQIYVKEVKKIQAGNCFSSYEINVFINYENRNINFNVFRNDIFNLINYLEIKLNIIYIDVRFYNEETIERI